MQLPDSLAPQLKAQLGLVRRDELLAHGVSRDAIRWALSRTWRLVLPGVVATFTGALSPRQELIAAALWAGEDAVLTGICAARWHQVGPLNRWRPYWFLTDVQHAARSSRGVRVTRTRRPDVRPWQRPPLLVAHPARALADAARELRYTAGADALVIEAVQRGIVSADDLRHEAEAGPRRWSAGLRRALDAVDRHAWSFPEAALLDICDRSRTLPRLWANPLLQAADGTALPTPDGWLDDVGLAIQVHSVMYHALSDEWDGTLVNDGVYAEYGICMIPFTPARLRDDPVWALERIERAHATLLGRPRPSVRATERSGLLIG
ncbi:hypothetical protein [Kineosporia sp. R_H_3]|uniref:hypothetical protein n=1 Tax=Kineosporia sp. R_H_3 TaxID=1961848 RepID=UPI000B4B88A8|nr:hypothetical protein [Kineosporia sp. R_H_3]